MVEQAIQTTQQNFHVIAVFVHWEQSNLNFSVSDPEKVTSKGSGSENRPKFFRYMGVKGGQI